MDGQSRALIHLNQERFRGLIFLSLHHMEPVVVLLRPQKMVFLHFGGTFPFPLTDKRETIPREASLFFTEYFFFLNLLQTFP